MAGSQQPLASCEISSFIRGVHAYNEEWMSYEEETLSLQREPENSHDKYAVAVVKDAIVVGHVPFNLAPLLSSFLSRPFNNGTAEVTGPWVNCRAGYGLELPCVYQLNGPQKYIAKLEELTASLY